MRRPPPPSSTSITFKERHGFGPSHRVALVVGQTTINIESNSDQTVLELDNVRHGIIYKHGKPYLRVRANHMSVNTESRATSASPGHRLHVETIGASPHRSFDTTVGRRGTTHCNDLSLAKHVTVNTAGFGTALHRKHDLRREERRRSTSTAIDGPVRFK